MTASSFNQLFRGGALQRDGAAIPELRAHRAIDLHPPLDRDELRGKVDRARGSGGGGARLSQGLDKRLGAARRFGVRDRAQARGGGFDARQRAVVKIHYFGHGGGGGAALLAHARYVARDAAGRESPDLQDAGARDRERTPERTARDHGAYLGRDSAEAHVFYDALGDGVDGGARMAVWAREDCRHFRIILAPEKGAELGDLKPYARDVMERAEAALGTRLEWVAVDHDDTDNPHVHIVLRGRRADGRALVIPRDFVQHGFREAARDAATDRLGLRTRADERLALAREVRAHRPTRLDALLARHIEPNGEVRIARIEAPNGDPALTNAMKARARELQRLGFASERRRNVLSFQDDWRARLTAMELHLDIRKRIVLERSLQQRGPDKGLTLRGLLRGLGR
jgi:hypothetical protein